MKPMRSRLAMYAARLLFISLLLAAIVPAYRFSHLYYANSNGVEAASGGEARKSDDIARARSQEISARPRYVLSVAERNNLQSEIVKRPLSPELIAVAGLLRQARTPADELAAVKLANRVSRRDSLAGLALIEAAVSSEDIPAAIRHYNNVLSVHPSLREALFPLLADAISFPEVRKALIPYIARPANWTGEFLYVAAKEGKADSLAVLLTPLPAALRNDSYKSVMSIVLHHIAEEVGLEAAKKFASELIPGLDSRMLSVLEPSPQTLDRRLGALAWELPNDSGVSIDASSSGLFELTIQPLANGLAAQRNLLVEGGRRYALKHRMTYSDATDDVRLIWSASCKRKGQSFTFWSMRHALTHEKAAYTQVLQVPAQCLIVTFKINVEGPDGQFPVKVKLDQFALESV